MFPTVFTVENDADQGRLGAINGLADAAQPGYEILRRGRRLAALIMKADHVAQRVIPKYDAQFGVRLADFIRSIHPVWVADGAPIVPTDETLSRLAENFF